MIFLVLLLRVLAALSVVAADDDASVVICPRIAETTDDQTLFADDPTDPEENRFNEISGLVFSATQTGPSGDPILYAVNDSGGGKRLGIFDSGTGERLLTLRLTSLQSSRDWEALTLGSCGILESSDTERTTESCIYIADVGDNGARGELGAISGRPKEPIVIFKVQEPLLDEFEENEDIPSSLVTTLQFDYMHPDSPTPYADCEAVFLDHASDGDLYVLTKWSSNLAGTHNRLFLIPPTAWMPSDETESFSAIPVTDESSSLMGKGWTRAEMTFDGSLVILGTYDHSYLFVRCPGQELARAFDQPHCRRWANTFSDDAGQFETIAVVPDASRILQISECRPKCDPPMVWSTLEYSTGTPMCGPPTAAPTVMPTPKPPTTPIPTTLQPVALNTSLATSSSPSFVQSMNPTRDPTTSPTLGPLLLSSAVPTRLDTQNDAPSGAVRIGSMLRWTELIILVSLYMTNL